MRRLSESEIRRRMRELLAEQMARPSLKPMSRIEEEAEAFALEMPHIAGAARRRPGACAE